jgi:hypothetical protein
MSTQNCPRRSAGRALSPLGVAALVAAFAFLAAACGTDEVDSRERCVNDRDCSAGVCENGFCRSFSGGGGGGGGDVGGGGGQDLAGDSGPGADVRTDTGGGNEDLGRTDVSAGDAGRDADADVPFVPNACGGVAPLEGDPGSECGECGGGTWVCNGFELVDCVEPRESNGCGGCGELEAEPRTVCDRCPGGLWVCADENSVNCNCPGGGDPDGTCDAPFPLAGAGTFTVDLCGNGDDSRAVAQDNCGGQQLFGEDVVYSFSLDAAADVSVVVEDADDMVAIDTITYLRTSCGEATSQVACHDDVACTVENEDRLGACVNTSQPRQSRMGGRLEAGRYFLIVDSFSVVAGGQSFDCGTVRVTISGN